MPISDCRGKKCCCCTGTFRGEVLCGPMFDVVVVEGARKIEPHHHESTALEEGGRNGQVEVPVTTRHLDLMRTFSPQPRVLGISLKLFLAAWILAILALSIEQKEFPSFWLAYLTHWGYTMTVTYCVVSTICAIYLALRPPSSPESLETLNCCCGGGGDGDDRNDGLAKFLIKTTWALLSIVIPAEVMITILFWVLEYESGDSISYVTVMVHGGAMILLIIDGFLLSRIPLRLKQFVFFESFSCLYLFWNIIHAYSGIGNPYDGISQDDDAIYSSLDWNTTPVKAIIMSVMILLVANPILFLFLWWLSRLLPLRLREERKSSLQTIENHEMKEHEQVPVIIH